ncbi:hypothetical protein [Dokdonia sp.]|uniref:hypothetical protein n=1 Tax=Dokdonia sp. TaxID=2024995 RepID=UPI0032674A6F
MKKKPSKANLFRFVTLRNPQLIAEESRDHGFVFFPTTINSKFIDDLDGASNEDQKTIVQAEVASNPPLLTKRAVRNQNVNLYRFSSWLMRNKNALTYVEIKNNIAGVAALTDEKELKLWDNLVYQTIERTSVYVREALIQMLITNKFVKAFVEFSKDMPDDLVFTEDQEKEFIRRAHASVVISKSMFNTEGKTANKNKYVSKRVRDAVENEMKVILAKERITSYEELMKELNTAEIVVQKENQEAYDTALDSYNAHVDSLIKNAKAVVVEEVNPVTGKTESRTTYPDLVIPEFSFEAKTETDETILSKEISKNAFDLLRAEGLLIHNSIAQVKQTLVETIARENGFLVTTYSQKAKRVKIGGSIVRLANRINVPTADYNVSPLHEINPSGERDINMQIYRQINGAQIVSTSYEAEFSNGTSLDGTDFTVTETSSGTLLKLFPNLVVFPSATYTLTGEITLDDSRVLNFEQEVVGTRLNLGDFEEATGNGTVDTSDKQVYGVTKLGIADFRRVEQEVCCYVAGEVSHIENILAREYKERATRSLTSVETTTEETTEREVENLKDTSTTERFELQSETSSIINEDSAQDAGANAGVNGSYPGGNYSASAFFNTSSSSSSSNSNSEAQTYAEEVTERALERVVEKVTRKRTSRILKEYEENNKHGFDNTQGGEHVTGIYRWVDKIYNNQLINYGKRLMYEFAIPEPSKFFKEAIFDRLNSGDVNTDTAVLPEEPQHPRDHGMTAATVISAGNYRGWAAPYNAEVNAVPNSNISVGESFNINITGGAVLDHTESNSGNGKINIPEGYKAVSVYGVFNASSDNDSQGNILSLTIGNKTVKYTAGFHNRTLTLTGSVNPYEGEIPVSYTLGNHVSGDISASVNCVPTTQALQQWQLETFNAIMDAYEEQLQAYRDALAAIITPVEVDPKKVSFNPLFNRSIEKKEIKRIAIELLAEQLGQTTAQNNYGSKNDLTGVSTVTKNSTFNTHVNTVKFFEQAFDWEIMAYLFYPYFYAEEENWKSLFQETEAADPIFQAFLQSGMARAVVPVRPGFEDAVNWYMETGELWEGQGLVIAEDSDLYVSISEEMQTVDGEVEREWETRVPTSLTILQAESASLIEGGLPCFCEDKEEDSTITRSDAKLIGQAQQATEGGEIIPPATF